MSSCRRSPHTRILEARLAAHVCQPHLEPPGTGQERAALRPQPVEYAHCRFIGLDDFREIENGHADVDSIEENLDRVPQSATP